ncbi:MAG: anthranilate phosphoribosyltransferase, partial [Myxococcota bacterium]
MLKAVIQRAASGMNLAADEIAAAVGEIMDGDASDAQIAALLVALRMKGETVDEIEGAARAMRARMNSVTLDVSPLLDTCGTGGDSSGTFNISTAVAFVAAAAGIYVAKHGNRAVSSRSGSADVLRELGVNLDAPPGTVEAAIRETRIGFLFAPHHHPAMKHATPIRRELGMRTIFNVLGPLTNPAGAPNQLLGVFTRDLVSPIAHVLGRLGSKRAWVVHGEDGLDELTVCGMTHVAEWNGEQVVERTVVPEDVGLKTAHPESLKGGTPEENAAIIREVLSGSREGPARDVVALNAGAALVVCETVGSLEAGVQTSLELLRNGAPMEVL